MPTENPSPFRANLTDAQSLLAAGTAVAEPFFIDTGTNKIPAVMVPPGHTVAQFETALDAPVRKKAHPTFVDATSFSEYVNRFKLPDTVIFANITHHNFKACIDWHSKVDAHWCDHWATLHCERTVEWKDWEGLDGDKMTQSEFGNFLEKYELLIVVPKDDTGKIKPGYLAGAALREVVMNLEITSAIRWSSAKKVQNGSIAFSYTEDVEDVHLKDKTLSMPSLLHVGLRPFIGSTQYGVDARIRYRLEDKRAVIWFELVRPQDVIDQTLKDITELIAGKTSITPFLGSPV